MMVVIRYISKVLVWILTILVVIGTLGNCRHLLSVLHIFKRRKKKLELVPNLFAGGTGVLWWLYADHRNALKNNTASVFGKEVAADNVKALLVYAICATVFTVCQQTFCFKHLII